MCRLIITKEYDTMKNLPEYKRFDEKNPFFEQDVNITGETRIDTIDQFVQMYDELRSREESINQEREGIKQRLRDYLRNIYRDEKSEPYSDEELNELPEIKIYNTNLMYRGVKEARYKIFTSAFREWYTGEFDQLGINFKQFVQCLVDAIRANKLLKDYYKSLRIETNDLLYMSMLQHYCNHSPMLDLTHNLDVAIYFALDGIKSTNTGSELDDYFSIYAFDVFHAAEEWNPIDLFLVSGQESAQRVIADFRKRSHAPLDTFHVDNVDDYTKWINPSNGSGLSDIPLYLFKNPLHSSFVFPQIISTGEGIYWSNLNLMAQEGGFLLYNNDSKPLEEYLLRKTNVGVKPIICYNIRKALKDEIIHKGYLKLQKEDIYPDMNKLTKECMEKIKAHMKGKEYVPREINKGCCPNVIRAIRGAFNNKVNN